MYEAHLLLRDLAVVLSVAAAVTILFRLLHQPPVLGYLLAGVIIGPSVPIPLFADMGRIRTLSELGVILVMFALGLEFSIRRVIKLAPTAGLTGALQLSGMIWAGYSAGLLLGWTALESLFAGAMLAISSTMIVARTFSEENVEPRLSEIVYGVLIVQDLAAVVLLAVLTAVAHGGGANAGDAVAETAGELAGFLVLAVVVGFLVVPRFIRLVARLDSPETLLITSIGLCFAASLLAQELGYSVALGAFLAGSLVAESGHADQIERLVHPIRDLFAAVFFVAVGMMVDPSAVWDRWPVVLLFTGLVLVVQPSLVAIGTFLAGNDIRTSVRAGMSLGQIGEFSFIIAGVGVTAGAIGSFFYPVAVAVCVLTSFTTPWMVRGSTGLALAVERRLPRSVQTFASLYGSWREQLHRRPAQPTAMARVRRLVLLMLVDGAILTAIPIAASIVHRRTLHQLGEQLGAPEWAMVPLLVAVAAALALPFVIGLVRCARSLGRTLAAMVLPTAESGTLDLAAAPRRAFVVALQLAMALLVGLPFLAVTQPFLPSFIGVPLLLVVLASLGLAFWRSAANLEEHVQAGAHLVLETLSRQVGAPETAPAPLHEVQSMLPGLGSMTAVTLPATSPAIGQTLVDLDLRGLTGASVIAIARAEGSIAAPTGREILAAGDVLTLTGTEESVEAAIDLLGARES